jgi:hypothetical protein
MVSLKFPFSFSILCFLFKIGDQVHVFHKMYHPKIIITRSTLLYLFIGHLTNLVFSIDYEEEINALLNSKGLKKILETFSLIFLILLFSLFYDIYIYIYISPINFGLYILLTTTSGGIYVFHN